MKKEIWVVHFVGNCRDCTWHNENYVNGQALAAKHAKKHKHLVEFEIGLCGKYKVKIDETDY